MIKCKSVYAKQLKEDGTRILVDFFWPEGIKTHEAHVDQWLRELGPSYDLQRFDFNSANWEGYKTKYLDEIRSSSEKSKLLQELANKSRQETVTLLYGDKDPKHNHAVILKEHIEKTFMKR
ncbi:MAG: DUF488 domain-containing protein [bacterium]